MEPAVYAVLAAAALSSCPVGSAIAADDATAGPAQTAPAGIEEIVVTAQKRQESIQSVPIAVSAFSAADLEARRLDGGQDLQLSVPNMSFSRSAYGTSNYQIRGIGYQVVSTGGDDGVGIHENNAPLTANRLSDADFYDMTRVEVLRGPQGTLFGRNATGGVINLITAKPTHELNGDLSFEYGNFNDKKFKGFVNIPFGEVWALRLAGSRLKRSGFQTNVLTDTSIDGRDLWSTRATLSFTPSDRIRSFLMWEHFKENDDRDGGLRGLCIKDPGPTSVGGVPTNPFTQNLLSRGCLQGSIYSNAAATSTVNSVATLAGVLGTLMRIIPGDAYAGKTQSADLRKVEAFEDPLYYAKNDTVQLNVEWDLTHGLTATALTSFFEDRNNQRYDGQLTQPSVPFANTPFTPGRILTTPQLGPTSFDELEQINNLYARQWSQELRLQSAFDGPVNFNVGGIYIHLKRLNDVLYVANADTAYAECINAGFCPPVGGPGQVYIDPKQNPDGTGHNYYISHNPYELKSAAAFGEVYWQVTSRIKLTGGLRYTDDRKSNVNYPVELLLPGRGWPSGVTPQHAEFKETTGRFNIDYRPTDDTLLYASYSKGYKGGGFNPPDVTATSPTYKPEFVNAYELGTKNTLFERTLTLDLTGFYYNYVDYQISQYNALTTSTTNVDAKIHGFELESAWQPVQDFRIDGNVGYLRTKISSGQSVDPFNRTGGDPALTLVKATSSACVSPTAAVAALLAGINAGAIPPAALLAVCDTVNRKGILPNTVGVYTGLKGHELPNSPHWTGTIGAQYTWHLGGDWHTTFRADTSYQSGSFATLFNEPSSDRLRSWDITNLTLGFDNPSGGWRVQLFARNVFDKQVISGFAVTSDALGLVRNINLLDPRLFGIVIGKSF
jgi:outer membrane receptor protein involved in Fe transport